jgi:hypothetical protein
MRSPASRSSVRSLLPARTTTQVSTILGFIAVVCSTTNVVGGFVITDRMLKMFKRKEGSLPKKERTAPRSKYKDKEQISPTEPVQTYFIELSYLLASILFILGLKGLSHPETAKRGMHLAEFGMLMAIIGTLMHHEIVTYTWIIAGLAGRLVSDSRWACGCR